MDLALLMFPALFLLLFIGVPVAYSLFGVSLVFGFLRFGDKAVFQFVSKVQDVAGNYILAAVPLFIFMGCMLERAGIAERLFDALFLWTRKLPGGLAVCTILLGVVFAAASGVVGATETVIGSAVEIIWLALHPHGVGQLLIEFVLAFPLELRVVPRTAFHELGGSA